MLTLEALASTRDLVAQLADKGVTLCPIENTPIAEALSVTKTHGQEIRCLTEIDALPTSLYEPKIVDGIAEMSMHDSYLESTSTKLGMALAGHISHATTVVLPAVAQMHSTILKAQDIELRSGIRTWHIESTAASIVYDNPAIVSEIDKYSSISARDNLELILDYPTLGDEEIVSLMKIGSESYDSTIDQFVAEAGMDNVRKAYEVAFTAERHGYRDFDMFRADKKCAQLRYFTVFLIATKLLTDTEDLPIATGENPVSNNKRLMHLKSLQEACGHSLYIALERERNLAKSGRLVDKVDDKSVYVYKDAYDRWISEGGDVEVLLGAIVSGVKLPYAADLEGKEEQYRTAWSYHSIASKQAADSETVFEVRKAVMGFIRQYIRESDDTYVMSNGDAILKRANEAMEKITRPSLLEPEMLCLKVVCRTIFPHTDAFDILVGVNEAMAQNPDIEREDALNLSVLQYVAQWYAEQIEIL